MPIVTGRPAVAPALPTFSADETPAPAARRLGDAFAPGGATGSVPGLRSSANDAVEQLGADLADALARGSDPNVPTRLPLEAVVRFAARAAVDVTAGADRGALADEVRRQGAAFAFEPMTRLSLGVLEQLVRYAQGAPEPAQGPREQLEAWLVLAAQGKRAAGFDLGRWAAPYVIGTTDIPRSGEVISGVGRLIGAMTGAEGPVAHKHLTRYQAIDAIRAEAAKGPLNAFVWGHSAGGPAAIGVANALEADPNVAVKGVLMLDPVNVLRLPPRLPEGKPEVTSLYLGSGNLFEAGPGWRRWHVPAASSRAASLVQGTDHFGMLGALYDRGVLQQLAARAVLGD